MAPDSPGGRGAGRAYRARRRQGEAPAVIPLHSRRAQGLTWIVATDSHYRGVIRERRLNAGIELCRTKGDNGTRALFESILQDEEEAIDWAEAQLGMIKDMGLENYLAQQMAG